VFNKIFLVLAPEELTAINKENVRLSTQESNYVCVVPYRGTCFCSI